MKRNYIQEINERKERLLAGDRRECFHSLDQLGKSVGFLTTVAGKFSNDLLKYIPIATINIIQNYFKAVISDLINLDSPYRDRLSKFNELKNYKLDFAALPQIKSKSITTGEFISHLIDFNSLDEINDYISILIGNDFLNILKNYEEINKFNFYEDNFTKFKDNVDNIYADVQKMFEMRHIFSHELATNVVFADEVIHRCFHNSVIFLNVSDNYINKLIHPNLMLTNVQISDYFHNEMLVHKETLNKLVEKINTNIEDDMKPVFDKANEHWKVFADIDIKARLKLFEGGSIYGAEYASLMSVKLKRRVESLKEDYKDYLVDDKVYEIN